MLRAADANGTTYEKYKTISVGTYINLCATEDSFIQTFVFKPYVQLKTISFRQSYFSFLGFAVSPTHSCSEVQGSGAWPYAGLSLLKV